MSDPATNLRILKPSRKKVSDGDIFVFSLDGVRYHFGRVIRTDVEVGGFPEGVLVYLYRASSKAKHNVPRLQKEELLVAPLATNRLPWRRGYFETVASQPLRPEDVFPKHCFRSVSGRYFDEMANEVPAPVEPVGEFALQSFRSIDDLASDALGFPRVP